MTEQRSWEEWNLKVLKHARDVALQRAKRAEGQASRYNETRKMANGRQDALMRSRHHARKMYERWKDMEDERNDYRIITTQQDNKIEYLEAELEKAKKRAEKAEHLNWLLQQHERGEVE